MTELLHIPIDEFRRLETIEAGPEAHAGLFADMCRVNTLYMITRAGSGHIGSSFSAMDIVAWLYLNEIKDDASAETLYFSSKGHDAPGLYSILIALGKLDFPLLGALRRLDGLPGHPDVEIPHITTNTGSLGMGVSKAKGMVEAAAIGAEAIERVFVLLGDGELQEGQLWESLQGATNRGLDKITAIVDHNKIQSDTWVENVSNLGQLEDKFGAFGWHVERCDGHDFGQIQSALQAVKGVSGRPQVIIADTIKGRGVSFMEHTAMTSEQKMYRFHSGAPDAESYRAGIVELIAKVNRQLEGLGADPLRTEGTARTSGPSATNPQRLVAAYSKALIDQAEKNEKIVALDADLILDTGLIPFQERFPTRFIECGIAEQDMVSQAGGMALRGLLPVAHSFACFLTTRPNEQIYNNASERRKVIYVGSLAGILPAGPGHSHQSVRDISVLGSVPGLVMVEPSCEAEVDPLMDYCFNRTSDSVYIRLVSIPCDIPYRLPTGYVPEEGRGCALVDGSDAVIFAYGPVMLSEACKASTSLRVEAGVGLKVVNLPWLNRIDGDWLAAVVAGINTVVTVDNHYIRGGQGDMIASMMAGTAACQHCRIEQVGLSGIPRCGENNEVLRWHGFDARSLAQRVMKSLGRRSYS